MEGNLKQMLSWQRIKQNKDMLALLLRFFWWFWGVGVGGFFLVLCLGFFSYDHEREGVGLVGFFWSDMILTIFRMFLMLQKY